MPPISSSPVKLPTLIRRLNFKFISTSVHLRQGVLPAVADGWEGRPSANPASGIPRCKGNWWNSIPSVAPADSVARIPVSVGFLRLIPPEAMQSMARTLDAKGLMDRFADWMAEKRWADAKQLFECWIRTLDANGKPNEPDVSLYNCYLQANLMVGASPEELLDVVAQMDDSGVYPNTASFNLVLKAMQQDRETQAAEKLIERMLQIGKECVGALPDDESYDLVIRALLSANQIDSSLKYIDLTLKSGYVLSMNAFVACVQSCVNNGRLDTLVTIIERCKKMDQNKSLRPPWHVCNYIADVAMQSDNSNLTYLAFEFMAKWIAGDKNSGPSVLSVDEGLVVSALSTAGRTCNPKLLDCSWDVLKRSLRRKVPAPESYLAKIYAHANMGNLQKAFSTLHEFVVEHGNSDQDGDIFSPFHSLNPLVTACSKKGLLTLDAVYHQLENLCQADPPIKYITALNCIILCCANMWDVDRAYRAFNSIDATFGLTPNIHSYNALICAYGRLRKRDEAVKLLDQFIELGVKPNMTTYILLIDAHLIMRDPKAALSVISDMIHAGCEPSKEMLKKVRRRCVRELDYKSDAKVESLLRQFKVSMCTEVRRDLLFYLRYEDE